MGILPYILGSTQANSFMDHNSVQSAYDVCLCLYRSENQIAEYEVYAAQFGITAPMDNELFSKKLLTSLVYDPTTGHVETISTEMIKK